MKKLISVVTGCYNEEGNVQPLYERICAAFASLDRYDFEIIYIDNCSSDATVAEITQLCARDPRVKLIVNARNFGHIRSPYHALLQARGDAAICMASDLQDPPELIPEFLKAWEEGAFVAAGVYERPPESGVFGMARRLYYRVMTTVSETPPIPAFTGFGLYDRRIIELLRRIGGPYPYVRGLVSELGLPIRTIAFKKHRRAAGITKNNFLTLVDMSLLGLTSMSRAPIRFATLIGAGMSLLGFLVALGYLVAKLVFWESFPLGQAPLLIGIFLFGSVQILVAGLIGEYIASLHQHAQNRPHVVELYRVNFESAEMPDPALGPRKQAAAQGAL
jgi:glycosyltransferase involved in cell wall biosynthesis